MLSESQVKKEYDEIYASGDKAGFGKRNYSEKVVFVKGLTLDLGCGDADYDADLSDRGFVGADLSYVGLKTAKSRHPGAEFVCASATCLPFKESSFDTVSYLESLSTMGSGYGKALDEVARVLKGRAYISAAHPGRLDTLSRNEGLQYRLEGRVGCGPSGKELGCFFTEESLSEEMTSRGLKVEASVTETFGDNNPGIMAAVLEGRRTPQATSITVPSMEYLGNLKELSDGQVEEVFETKDAVFVVCSKPS